MRLAIVSASSEFDFISRAMVPAGHYCHAFATAKALYAQLRHDTFDLIVLDCDGPDEGGLAVLRWMAANIGAPIPALLISDKRNDEDVIAALAAGADDYVARPVAASVLLARLNTMMRRIKPRETDAASETHGLFVFHPTRQTVMIENDMVVLTTKEFDLAITLFRNMHRPLSRAYLHETVWGRSPDVPSRTLDVHISRIRTKLGLRPDRGFRLVHVYSYGYRLEVVEV